MGQRQTERDRTRPEPAWQAQIPEKLKGQALATSHFARSASVADAPAEQVIAVVAWIPSQAARSCRDIPAESLRFAEDVPAGTSSAVKMPTLDGVSAYQLGGRRMILRPMSKAGQDPVFSADDSTGDFFVLVVPATGENECRNSRRNVGGRRQCPRSWQQTLPLSSRQL